MAVVTTFVTRVVFSHPFVTIDYLLPCWSVEKWRVDSSARQSIIKFNVNRNWVFYFETEIVGILFYPCFVVGVVFVVLALPALFLFA
jgi:hypothetical protein